MPIPATRQPRFMQLQQADLNDQAGAYQELATGLLARPASVAPKYFYDALGSRLFDAITELPEYYPTRTETELMATHAAAIAQRLPRGATLVDLGAGNCAKAARLFPWIEPVRYVAVDISVDFLRLSLQCLQREHPQLEMLGVGMDFSAQLALPSEAGAGARVLFYPGSSIGNFTPAQALDFLRQARAQVQGGGLLIGVDLVKPREVLEPAYDDALGVTAAFNKNLLLHLNRLLGADFDLRDWRHVALFNAGESRIEMHLQAERALTVCWRGGERLFERGERIHTENSYKYHRAEFEALLRQAGFTQVDSWTDARDWFALCWAQG